MSAEEQPFDWDELLLLIDERRVIPVVGAELLSVDAGAGEIPLFNYLAEQLADKLRVSRDRLPAPFDLNDVALAHLHGGGKEHKIYSTLRATLRSAPPLASETLDKLACITDFTLYVSLTFDCLLEEAIGRRRFDGKPVAQSLVYSTARTPDDLPADPQLLDVPHVYHLFGIASTAKDYAVTDEDVLEYLHCLQSESKRPAALFDALRDYHLLFIGCGFENWLERFVVRCITNEPLVTRRSTMEFVVDDTARSDERLTVFLRQYGTEVFLRGSPAQFVDALYERWEAQRPEGAAEEAASASAPAMDSGGIFLSYASEDRDVVHNMKTALEEAGLDVWFDQGELRPGDAWDRQIQAIIRRCAVFLPFVSRQAQGRLEGYFRKEWRWAIERDQGMDESLRFIQPIVLDDTPENADHIPPQFWSRHCSSFPDGEPSGEFVEQLRQIVRSRRLQEAGRA